MASVQYRELPFEEIDTIAPLWEKLNEYHAEHSTYFARDFRNFSFDERKRRLAEEKSRLRILLAETAEGEPVGYAVGSIAEAHAKTRGELDSMYVKAEWRGHRIGEGLATRILDWLDENGVTNIVIAVAAGNEKALKFYDRLGFAPRAYTLRRKPQSEE